jgi:hypothetical protein
MKTLRAIKRANIPSASTRLIARHGFNAKHVNFELCKSSVIQQWLKYAAAWLERIAAVILSGVPLL